MSESSLNKIEVVVFDWAGTTVDFGCLAPLYVFLELFKSKGIEISVDEAKKPMGMLKKDHIRELFKMSRIRAEYIRVYGQEPNEKTIEEFYQLFEKFLLDELPKHADVLPGVVETMKWLRESNIKIGSTSGYIRSMMDVLEPLVELNGYKPDFCVTSSEVPNGRPYPWMIFANGMKFGKFNFSNYIKVGDTVVDIEEGRNANCWSVGVLEGSSLLGLSLHDLKNCSIERLDELKRQAREDYVRAGADYVINSMFELPDIVQKINKRLESGELPGGRLKTPQQPYILFTPGPLLSSLRVKLPTLVDLGSREKDFIGLVNQTKSNLLNLVASSGPQNYEIVLMQGSGTFGVESVVSTSIPKQNSKFLVIINGQYGKRMAHIADVLQINTVRLEFDESEVPDEAVILRKLEEDVSITHVGVIHSETTTGILNPIEKIASLVKSKNKILIVDCMSSFGAIPIDVNQLGIDFAIGSSNKGFQGVPGFSFIVAKLDELKKTKGNSRSYSLDMYDQYKFSSENDGGFRFTPPVHAIRAFHEALVEVNEEGGIHARFLRYKENQKTLEEGMKKLGFRVFDLNGNQGPIITTFHSPKCPKYNFDTFYESLKSHKCVIYPGKLTKANTFRIGSIGNIHKSDIVYLLGKVKECIYWNQNLNE